MEVPNMNMITPAMKRQLMAMSGITDMKEFDEIVSKLGRAHTGYLTRNNTTTHIFTIYDEWQTQPAEVLALP